MKIIRTFHQLAVFVLCAMLVFLWACKDESDNYFDEETITIDAATGMMEAYDVLELDYLAEVYINAYQNPLSNGCTLFTDSAGVKRLTLDFGTNCIAPQYLWLNRNRSGKIIVAYPTVIGDTAVSRSITFDKYMAGGKRLQGELRMDVDSISSKNIIYSTCRFVNFKVLFPDGTEATFNGIQSRAWTSGMGNKIATDNTYLIKSVKDSLTGMTPSGLSYKVNLTTPVTANFSCALNGSFAGKSGVVEVTGLSGYPDRVRNVNFGNDLCDKIVTVTTYRRTWSTSVN